MEKVKSRFGFRLVVLFTCLGLSGAFQANDTPIGPFDTVKELFAAMSAYDGPRMHATAVENFELLEVGEVWSMDRLANEVLAMSGEWHRRNWFSLISERHHGDVAWVSYWNRADLTSRDGTQRSVSWLESAILVRVDGQWLLEQLHSTRLGGNSGIPDDAVMQEHMDETSKP